MSPLSVQDGIFCLVHLNGGPVSNDLQIVGSLNELPGVSSISVIGDYAYITSPTPFSNLYILDISDITSPNIVSFVPTWGSYDSAVSGSFGYVAVNVGGLQIFDVSDPLNPYQVGFIDTPGNSHGVAATAFGNIYGF